ncbi:MAG: type II toxin-antitoxin system prevent-host-death family antitoxin [Rubrivivax sp.]|jgi:prevent-host-death family protein|nr:type II toxin-antitoxin system prevent-host-death family antitoxin [Rubrivivax sp.]
MQVNILDAKNRLSQLVKAAQAGEEVVLANRGRPVARLVGIADGREPAASGVVAWLREHPLPAHARRSAAEIDADLQAERGAWD